MAASYEFTVEVQDSIQGTGAQVRDLLQAQGFGILTEIDVQATLREKLEQEFRPYRILGACNPALAHRALAAEPGIGVLLPCNVVLEHVTQDITRVRFMEPISVLGQTDNPVLDPIAQEASTRLHEVAKALG
ncbi:MAG: DUF302 domain-containing protein [Candidatus Dormibacter sp.]|uniref:DUF302 domain-containing protein n=1 Tax=Candidatus Dormibacter sp. TaxID=2973982 RepID=UPI000DAF906D|nr:MAG: hypothetical protein DLM66_10000 [Candidatus Dormibacteraeota bacterium]